MDVVFSFEPGALADTFDAKLAEAAATHTASGWPRIGLAT